MTIHHTKIKRALEIGCYLSQVSDKKYRIYWTQGSLELFAASPDEAISKMIEAQSTEPETYSDISGVPRDGGEAYKQGVPASDCPFAEESDDFSRWNDEWDRAADEATEIETREKKPGSVVRSEYRARYSESGHPTNCGDDLAVLLNNLCLNKAGVNLELFEAICAANEVDLKKYDRTKRGWQGRLRMTGRNLLSKVVKENGGLVKMPPGYEPEHYQMDANWVEEATRKFKPKGEQK